MRSKKKWVKRGLLYRPKAVHPKLLTHAANPLAILLENSIYRVYYSGRDAVNRSSVGFVDIDIDKFRIEHVCTEPVFEHGCDGSFYSHGVSLGADYEADGRRYVLFMGWQCPPGGHWRGEIGRLIMEKDYSLMLSPDCEFMSRDDADPISLSYPCVLFDRSSSVYLMWYGSTVDWDVGNGEMLHVLKSATSMDGHVWRRHGLAVPYEIGSAQAFSRPAVLGNAIDGYEMWFSYRGGSGRAYRIGYATSEDGMKWTLRLSETGIDVSSDGWDSEMTEYPFVFEHEGQHFMLYNGNDYGKSGFGLAVLER